MQQTLHGLRANQKERVEFLDTLRRVFRTENASLFHDLEWISTAAASCKIRITGIPITKYQWRVLW